ncbi:MAG: lipopolysaccharide biosynthesis protein [Chthonomonadaceae bacterium]|nr:lipopolysaccharide biosynthesis protein [Chthonomonadaceae bacterium]
MDGPSDKQKLTQRMARGIGANTYAQVVTIVSNLVTVPFFYRFWGIDLYGEWLALSAIPTYLTMSDLSFGTTAGSEMTMLAAQGKKKEALSVLQTAWLLVTVASIVIFAIALLLTWVAPLDQWLNFSVLSRREAASVMTLLLISVCLSQQGGLIDAGFKCAGHYAEGIFLINTLRLFEFFAGITILLTKGDPWVFAWTLIVPKALAYAYFWHRLRQRAPWLYLGWSHADRKLLKPMVSPALTFNAFNLGFAFSIQGIQLLVTALVSPAAAALFSNMRTLARIVWQGANAIGNTAWVELSRALGVEDYDFARKLHRRTCQIGMWCVLPGALLMLLVGPVIFKVLTGRTMAEPFVFAGLLLATVFGSFWTISYVVALSINKHQTTALAFILSTGGSLLLARLFLLPMGTIGAVLALLLGEIAMASFVFYRSLRLLKEKPGPFLTQLATPPFGLIRRLLHRKRAVEE